MNKQPRKTFAIILGIIFVIMNVLFVIWPLFLILEDIRSGTMHGTNIEMLVLLPYLYELLSIPVIICEILIIIFSIKGKKITVDDYSKTHEFILSDYEIIDYIKFVVTYDWFYQNGETHHTKSLYLYGQFTDGQFYITKEKTKHFG